MSIFIGRNISEESRTWLSNNQVDYEEQALIDIQLLEPDFAFFQKIANHPKFWIITSKWATKWLQIHHEYIGFQATDSVFCLSEKQARLIRTFSELVFVADEKNMKSLSELVRRKKQNQLCVCLKGNRSLEASGIESVQVEVYQNYLVQPRTSNHFDAYLFFSPSGIESFVQGGNLVSEKASIVAIGETTARKAKAVFNNNVFVSDEQSELATIKTAVYQLQAVL